MKVQRAVDPFHRIERCGCERCTASRKYAQECSAKLPSSLRPPGGHWLCKAWFGGWPRGRRMHVPWMPPRRGMQRG